MSTSKALGKRENWWGESDLDELQETPVSDLSPHEVRRVIEHTVDFNLDTDRMTEQELRKYLRTLREDGDRPQKCTAVYEVASYKAHQILREVCDKHSKTAKHAPPDRGLGEWGAAFAFVFSGETIDHDPDAMHTERCNIELTEPIVHVPLETDRGTHTVDYRQHRHRKRIDPEHGYIGGVAFDELPIGEFLDVVEDVLSNAKAEHFFRDEKIEGWIAEAKEMKQDPAMSDQDVLTELIATMYREV